MKIATVINAEITYPLQPIIGMRTNENHDLDTCQSFCDDFRLNPLYESFCLQLGCSVYCFRFTMNEYDAQASRAVFDKFIEVLPYENHYNNQKHISI